MAEIRVRLCHDHALVLEGDYTPPSAPGRHEPGNREAFELIGARVEGPDGTGVDATALLERLQRAVPGFCWGAWAEDLALAELAEARADAALERALAREEGRTW